MEEIKISSAPQGGSSVGDRAAIYTELLPQLESLAAHESDVIANLANISAALKQVLPYVSWVGFYLLKDGELVVGPFQGKVACTRIKIGSGVCGTAAEQRRTMIVPNVYEFPGHIFCDAESRSEIVVPLLSRESHPGEGGKLFGVLDLDSAEFNSFDKVDAENLEHVCRLVAELFVRKGKDGR
jgi:GAF domain-containing protein